MQINKKNDDRDERILLLLLSVECSSLDVGSKSALLLLPLIPTTGCEAFETIYSCSLVRVWSGKVVTV